MKPQTFLSPAFMLAKRVAENVDVPVPGTRLKTQITLVSDCVPKDKEDAAQAAKELHAVCGAKGTVSGFVMLFGDDTVELALNDIIRGLNGGHDRFTDGQGNLREFCSFAGDADDVSDKFDQLSQCTDADALVAQRRFKHANDKSEKISVLIKRQQEDLKMRKRNMLAMMAEEQRMMQDAAGAERRSLASQWAERKNYLEEIAAGHQQTCKKIEDLIGEQQTKMRELQEEHKNACDTLETLTSIYEKVAENFTDDKFLESARKQLEQAREKYSSMNPEKLVDVLSFAKDKMDECQIIFDAILQSFEMMCLPVENLLNQLEHSCEVDLTAYTATRKMVECYRKQGLSALDKTNFNEKANWEIIVSFHCPGASKQCLEVFTNLLTLNDFVSIVLLPPTDQEKAKQKLGRNFRNLLSARVGTTERGKPVVRAAKEAQRKRARLEESVAKLKESITSLTNSLDDDDISDAKRTKLECELERKEADLEKEQEKFLAADEDHDTKKDALDDIVDTEYADSLSMFARVHDGIRNVFGQVMLTKGLDVTSWSLSSLNNLFNSSIKDFCLESGRVSRAFLNGGQGTSNALALQYKSASNQSRLLDQFKHLGSSRSSSSSKCMLGN